MLYFLIDVNRVVLCIAVLLRYKWLWINMMYSSIFAKAYLGYYLSKTDKAVIGVSESWVELIERIT